MELNNKIKEKLDRIVIDNLITIAGDGYIDMICPNENIINFINEVSKLNIKITEFTWWCHVTEGHSACGYGGPRSRYDNTWYSEISMGTTHKFKNNMAVLNFLVNDWKQDTNYKECYTPGFWLDVPKNWKNKLN